MARVTLSLVIIAALLFSGCAALLQPVTKSGTPPAPVASGGEKGVDNPNIYVDPEAFEKALLLTLAAGDSEKLGTWMMTEPFLTGTWRGDLADSTPAEALKALYGEQLGKNVALNVVKDAGLKELLGGMDPRAIPQGGPGVIDTLLVSGWGQDGRDEAILFIARLDDNSVKWRGWMVIKGGFSGARLGGIKAYTNEVQGYSLYLPKDWEVSEPVATSTNLFAPGTAEPGDSRAAAFIMIEPANGRTSAQAAQTAITELGPGFTSYTTIGIDRVLGIEGSQAYVVNGLPGQDTNRQIYMVRDDRLFRIMFIPGVPAAAAYPQMEDIYTMLVNTWHFTK